MILAVDIGNTNIVLGCCDKDKILFRERVSTNLTATDLEYAVTLRTAVEMNGLDGSDIDGAIISSVVPRSLRFITSPISFIQLSRAARPSFASC